MHAELQQLGHRHQRGRATADAVEQGDHLRDGGHAHHARADGSDQRAEHESDGCDLQTGLREVEEWDGRAQRDHHARGGGEVAVARALGRAQLLQAEDEQHRGQEVRERDQRVHFLAACRPLNISSMRSVTTKPPTTLVVARVTATRPSTIVTGESAPAAIRMAPTRMMPWIALVPDISGVCRIVGTLEMTSKPTKTASTKIVSSLSSSFVMPRTAPASLAR